ELEITLLRFVPDLRWSMTITSGDVQNLKPAPDGLLAIAQAHTGCRLTYFGDNVDDARSARAAGVRFVGIAARNSVALREIFAAEGAAAVIESINEIEEVL
ncbi:MAG: HAD family hydrolase, partial [Verrucomicrobiota bacterium]|nr:HAD family hydrolase [Verrucomicrobiota bacterium]